jgi:hypothetical protein
MTTEEPIRGTLVIHNPYTVHLLYLKAHYVGVLLEKYYARRIEMGVDAYYRMMRCAILERHHVKWITQETHAMQRRAAKEHFGIDLVYCNIEYFLHRFTQVYRIVDESIDYGFVGKPYKCETAMSRLFLDNAAGETLRRSLYAYLEYYYLAPDEAKVESRVDLFFLLKKTLETDVDEELSPSYEEDNRHSKKRIYILRYSKEMIAILVQLYLVNEFIALYTLKKNEIHHDTAVAHFVYQPDETSIPVLTTTTTSDMDSPEMVLFVKMRFELQRIYRQEALLNTRYPAAKEMPIQQEATLSMAISDILFNTGIESVTPSKEEDEDDEYVIFKRANESLNMCMAYNEPPAALVSLGESSSSILAPRLYIEYDETTLRPRVINHYAYLRYDEQSFDHYANIVFRLLLEGQLYEAHRGCSKARSTTKRATTTICLLCDYFKLVDKKIREMYRAIHYYTVNHCYAEEYNDRVKLDDSLANHYIQPTRGLVSRTHRILYSMTFLYARLAILPLAEAKPLRERRLLTMLDPVKLFALLSRSLSTDDLENDMMRLLSQCGLSTDGDDGDPSDEALNMALELEYVKQIINAINAQQTEIEKYERSLTIEVSLNSSLLHSQVIHNLKLIYAAYLQILCHIIRRDKSKLTLM